MSIVLSDIKYFIVVCETLNVTRASEIIGISQPALSYSIKRLEQALGDALIIRLKNGIQLTKLGELFLERARHLCHEWESLNDLANPTFEMAKGNYLIAAHHSVALLTVGSFMPALQAAFPALNFQFLHGLSREMTEKVISFEADFGIVVNPVKHPDLVIHKLYDDEVSIFHIDGAEKKIIFDKNLTQSQFILKKINQKNQFRHTINSSNLEVIAKMTALGLGYGILPNSIARQVGHLKKMKDAPTFKDEICLVYRPEKHRQAVSKKIIEIIQSFDYQ